MPLIQALLPQFASLLPPSVRSLDVPANADAAALLRAVLVGPDGRPDHEVERLAEQALDDLANAGEQLASAVAAAWRIGVVIDVAGTYLRRADVDSVWRWLVRGLGGDPDATATEVAFNGLDLLIKESISGSVAAQDILAGFAEPLFYVGTNAGYLSDVLQHYDEPLLVVLLGCAPSDFIRSAVPQALTWMRQKEKWDLVSMSSRWCLTAARLPSVAPHEAIYLLYSGYFALPHGPVRRMAMKTLYDSLPEDAPAVLRFQIIAMSCEGDFDDLAAMMPAILTHIREVWDEADSNGGTAAVESLRERLFDVAGPIVDALAARGRIAECLHFLQTWSGIERHTGNESILDSVVLILDVTDGIRWCWNGGAHLMQEGMSLGEITDAINTALGTAHVTVGRDTTILHREVRPSHDRTAGQYFAAACRRYLDLNLTGDVAAAVSSRSLAVPLPDLRVPYQALIQERWTTPSVWVSLMPPLPDRWLDRVAVLEGDTPLAEIESRLVAQLLGQAGCEISCVASSDLDLFRFREVYSNAAVDAIWLSGHGKSPRFRPQDAKLLLPSGESVSISDLRKHPITSGRRLLFINTCDGAVTAASGARSLRGMAASAAHGSQAVVAHQWEVDDRTAATFSVLLALSCLDHLDDYLKAFNAALKLLRRPWEDIEKALVRRGCDVGDLKGLRPPVDFSENIFDYGAPAFFS